MMTYEIFKEVVTEKFKDYMPEQYKNMDFKIQEVNKVNRTLDGISMIAIGAENNVSPTIYINDMYDHYMKCNDLQAVMESAAQYMENAMHMVNKEGAIDFTKAKDNIVFQLINTEQNKEMLERVPHREFQDLSIVYRWIVKMDEEGIHSTLIKDKLAEQLGLTEEQLFHLAVENTRRILPPTVKSINEVMCEIFMKDGMPDEIAEMMMNEFPKEKSMWIVSNDRGINGAISMLYEDKLQALAMELDSDLYIMPSSVHEVIAVSASVGDPYELAQMVAETNLEQVALGERLSNQVYHYDKDLRKLTLATDTPNKSLDNQNEHHDFEVTRGTVR